MQTLASSSSNPDLCPSETEVRILFVIIYCSYIKSCEYSCVKWMFLDATRKKNKILLPKWHSLMMCWWEDEYTCKSLSFHFLHFLFPFFIYSKSLHLIYFFLFLLFLVFQLITLPPIPLYFTFFFVFQIISIFSHNFCICSYFPFIFCF